MVCIILRPLIFFRFNSIYALCTFQYNMYGMGSLYLCILFIVVAVKFFYCKYVFVLAKSEVSIILFRMVLHRERDAKRDFVQWRRQRWWWYSTFPYRQSECREREREREEIEIQVSGIAVDIRICKNGTKATGGQTVLTIWWFSFIRCVQTHWGYKRAAQ